MKNYEVNDRSHKLNYEASIAGLVNQLDMTWSGITGPKIPFARKLAKHIPRGCRPKLDFKIG